MDKWEYIKTNYIDKGLKIFPIVRNGKTPLIDKWQEECSCDYFQVLYWYTNCKDCNWGLPCTPNNLFVLDLDVHDENKNGIDNFEKLFLDAQGVPYDDYDSDYYITSLMQSTPSGGIHLIFESDNQLKNVANGSNVFKDYPGIDIRTDGYIVIEPSVINDKKYTFLKHVTPSYNNVIIRERKLSKMPEFLKNFILENANLKNDSKKEPYKKPTSVEVGDRDNQLFSYINSIYYKTSLDFDEILCLALHFNENVLEKPFPEKTVKYKVRKVFEKSRDKYIVIKLYDE